MSKVFAALAEPTRRDMVARLAVDDATVGELAAPYEMSIQAVSKHIKVLTDAGVVTQSRDAQRRPVHLEAEVFNLMTKWIERYRRQAEERYQVTITREFDVPPELVFTAHVDPEIFIRWIGPDAYEAGVDHWEARTGGSYRYSTGDQWFFGSFHQVLPDQFKIVQTWGWEGMPDAVSLDTYTFTELPEGRTLMTSVSLVESMEAQAGMLASGMEVGINQGYAKLDAILADG